MSNEDLIFQGDVDDDDLEVLEEGFLPTIGIVTRLPGPAVLPPPGTQHVDHDVDMTINAWREREKLHNKVNDLMTENADLKEEREVKKMAIEGLTVARERLHKERAELMTELEGLKEQVEKMSYSPQQPAKVAVLPNPAVAEKKAAEQLRRHSVGVSSPVSSGQNYDGVIISLDSAFQEKTEETEVLLASIVDTVNRQVKNCAFMVPSLSGGSSLDPDQLKSKFLYVKMNAVNIKEFLKTLTEAKDQIVHNAEQESVSLDESGSEGGLLPRDLLLSIDSSPAVAGQGGRHGKPEHTDAPHSVSTHGLLAAGGAMSSDPPTRIVQDLLDEVIADAVKQSAKAERDLRSPGLTSSCTQEVSASLAASSDPSLDNRHLLYTTSEEYYSAEGGQETGRRRRAMAGQTDRVPSIPVALDSILGWSAGSADVQQPTDPVPRQPQHPGLHNWSGSGLSPWRHASSISSQILPMHLLSSDTSSSSTASNGLALPSSQEGLSRYRRAFDLPTSRLAMILTSHHITPFGADFTFSRASVSDPALPTDLNLIEARVEDQETLEDLFVVSQMENTRLREENQSLRRSLGFVTRQCTQHVCTLPVVAGWDTCVRMTLGFVLHAVVINFIRTTFGL